MPRSVFFQAANRSPTAGKKARASLSHWCGMSWVWHGLGVAWPASVTNCVCPGPRLSFPLGPGFLIKPKWLGWAESMCSSAIVCSKVLSQCKFTYTHTYLLPIAQATEQALGYMNSQPHPHLPGLHSLLIKSNLNSFA